MKGAREFAKLFKTGQYGRLYITSSDHARGLTFHIQILPEGEIAKSNSSQNMCINSNDVEVYGIIDGQPGWTEEYGWLHEGKWQEDFLHLVKSKQKELNTKEELMKIKIKETEQHKIDKEKKLLNTYF